MSTLALAAAYCGLTGLSLAMNRHHQDVFGQAPSALRARLLRAGGWVSLALSLAACLFQQGWAFGSVLWVGLLAAAGYALVLLHTYRPRWIPRVAVAAPALGLLALALS